MKWRKLLTYLIFIGLFAPLWIWVTIASDTRFLNEASKYGESFHLFSMAALFSVGVLVTTFVFLKSRESGHNLKWLVSLLFILFLIAMILLPALQ